MTLGLREVLYWFHFSQFALSFAIKLRNWFHSIGYPYKMLEGNLPPVETLPAVLIAILIFSLKLLRFGKSFHPLLKAEKSDENPEPGSTSSQPRLPAPKPILLYCLRMQKPWKAINVASASHCARNFGEIPPRGTGMSPPTVEQPVAHATQSLDPPQRACRAVHQSASHTLRLVRLLMLVPLRDREAKPLREINI